ncbi:MAG: glycoside hydrolase family 10 protein [Candidatus Neomarinimicrobiota bacterium]
MIHNLESIGFRRVTFVTLLFFLTNFISAEDTKIKALWIVRDDMVSKKLIDAAISFSVEKNFTDVFVQIRGRGDAYYSSNFVPRADLISKTDFDPLAYIINKTKSLDLKIHAWLNVYYLWSSPQRPKHKDHLLLTHPDWIDTYYPDRMDVNTMLKKMKVNRSINGEGFYLAPTHPEVEAHLQNVITELLQNYKLDGIHFDYIRFHDSKSGMNPDGLRLFLNYNNSLPGLPSLELNKTPSFSDFKRASITSFIRKASLRIRAYQPNCIISAAVKPNLNDAKKVFHQEWDEWLIGGYIDWAILMNYTSSRKNFENNIQIIRDNMPKKYLNNILMGIGVYNQTYKSASEKINITKRNKFAGYSLFSYTVFKKDINYIKKLQQLQEK